MFFLVFCARAGAEVYDLENALRATYNNCVGIEDSLRDMKVMAGVNTAITGVGTGLGIGAVVAGVEKKKVDAEIEEIFKTLEKLAYGASSDVDTIDEEEWLKVFEQNNESAGNFKSSEPNDNKNKTQEIRSLTEKSKKLGKWRTGLLAGNTATNIAGAVISGANKVDLSLSEQIQNCKLAVQNLQKSIAQAELDDVDVSEGLKIADACKGFLYIDDNSIAKINNRAKGGMVSSVVGVGTGVVGVITSALANSDKIRRDNSQKDKEKNLNTAANVLATGSSVASATATVFNATQIKAIKDIYVVAEHCTEALR